MNMPDTLMDKTLDNVMDFCLGDAYPLFKNLNVMSQPVVLKVSWKFFSKIP